jgi:hypothetical protein
VLVGTFVPAVLEILKKSTLVCGGRLSAAGGRDASTPRRCNGNQNASEHHNESQNPDDRLVNHDAGDESRDADYSDEDAAHDGRVSRFASASGNGRDEVGVVVIETALHLFQEALLLLGKWHPVSLRIGMMLITRS